MSASSARAALEDHAGHRDRRYRQQRQSDLDRRADGRDALAGQSEMTVGRQYQRPGS
ncbi:hypothetical protein [Rhodococcus erythropolis]|uniref:hypothetical protein n=1 Tax=Rhodococcus erythropolis TaxID=1833 RepID=UPI001F1AC6CE|nr:hypothetical protein [Rhodococcus erythropolis]